MWSVRSSFVDIYLSGRIAAIRRHGSDAIVERLTGQPWEELLEQWAGDDARSTWRVWLGGQNCRLRMVEPIAGVRTIDEAETIIGRLASDDGPASEARLALWTRRRPWIACCTPDGLTRRIATLAQRHRIRLASIRPWWAVLPTSTEASVVCCDEESMSSWHCDSGGRVSKCSTIFMEVERQGHALQRMRVSGALQAYRLSLESSPVQGEGGFSVVPIQETEHASAS